MESPKQAGSPRASATGWSESNSILDEVEVRVVMGLLRQEIARQEAHVKVLQSKRTDQQFMLTEMRNLEKAGFACGHLHTTLTSRINATEGLQLLCDREIQGRLEMIEVAKAEYNANKRMLAELEVSSQDGRRSRNAHRSGRSTRHGSSLNLRSNDSVSEFALSTKSISSDSICSDEWPHTSPDRIQVIATRWLPKDKSSAESTLAKKMRSLQVATGLNLRRLRELPWRARVRV
mmetsp:Transcript_11476/g.24589  ORF Transcript_11476/g.24589 Transcript_11476/m.24589 type:complete len:234 (+) Transcript_11476:195-896(+)|eukprot:6197238-Pleurochrysis_carterae.AAC.1